MSPVRVPGHPAGHGYPGTGGLNAVRIDIDLLAWTRLLTLTGALAKAEPRALRHAVFHVGAKLVRGQRRRHLKFPTSWPGPGRPSSASDAVPVVDPVLVTLCGTIRIP